MNFTNSVAHSLGAPDLERYLLVGPTPWKTHNASYKHFGVVTINFNPCILLHKGTEAYMALEQAYTTQYAEAKRLANENEMLKKLLAVKQIPRPQVSTTKVSLPNYKGACPNDGGKKSSCTIVGCPWLHQEQAQKSPTEVILALFANKEEAQARFHATA
jgi:hypothetical protein